MKIKSIPTMFKVSLIGLSLFVFGLTFKAYSQDEPFKLPAQDMRGIKWEKQGELFTLKVIPASKEMRFYIVGKQQAQINFDKLSVTGKIKIGDSEKTIKFIRNEDYFSTKQPLVGDLNIRLEEKESKKMEEFRIKLDKP